MGSKTYAKSVIAIPTLKPEYTSILRNTPSAFLTTLLRPHIFESHNIMMSLSAIENVFILVLLIANIIFYIRKKPQGINAMCLFSLFFVFIIFSLIGLVTPVLGAVVRYKVAALPFLMVLLFYHQGWKLQPKFFNQINGK